jgi:predicted transcriptional regulator
MAFPVEKLMKNRLACSDVVQCAFDLGDQELRVYEALNNLGTSKTEEIARVVGRDASVVYRHLQKLLGCGVVTKEKRTLAEGGYYFVYAAIPKAEVKTRLTACVDDWHAQMKRAIERL